MSLWLTLLRWTTVRLAVLVAFQHGAVGGASCTSCHRHFGNWSSVFNSGLLTVVLHKTVTLGTLLALVVGRMVARNQVQVTVLWPHCWWQRMEGQFGVTGLDALLQKLIDGKVCLFDL